MNLKPILINTALAIGLTGCFAQAESLDQPQIEIVAPSYVVEKSTCFEYCTAKVKAGEYDIFVDYRLDDGSVEFLDILNVTHFDQVVNAYVDRYEIEKINAAIAGGVK